MVPKRQTHFTLLCALWGEDLPRSTLCVCSPCLRPNLLLMKCELFVLQPLLTSAKSSVSILAKRKQQECACRSLEVTFFLHVHRRILTDACGGRGKKRFGTRARKEGEKLNLGKGSKFN